MQFLNRPHGVLVVYVLPRDTVSDKWQNLLATFERFRVFVSMTKTELFSWLFLAFRNWSKQKPIIEGHWSLVVVWLTGCGSLMWILGSFLSVCTRVLHLGVGAQWRLLLVSKQASNEGEMFNALQFNFLLSPLGHWWRSEGGGGGWGVATPCKSQLLFHLRRP